MITTNVQIRDLDIFSFFSITYYFLPDQLVRERLRWDSKINNRINFFKGRKEKKVKLNNQTLSWEFKTVKQYSLLTRNIEIHDITSIQYVNIILNKPYNIKWFVGGLWKCGGLFFLSARVYFSFPHDDFSIAFMWISTNVIYT